MRVIGLLGGVASGKTLVARQLAELGAGLLEADRAGHEVLQNPKIVTAARQRWGSQIFGTDNQIDRARLAKIVFAKSPEAQREREYLEELTHPEIRRVLLDQLSHLADDSCTIAVLDAPLLLEAGWDKFCNALIMVDSPRQLRLARALSRGWKEEDFAAREDVQESLEVKRGRADVVVDNSGSPEQTKAQVERFWHSLIG